MTTRQRTCGAVLAEDEGVVIERCVRHRARSLARRVCNRGKGISLARSAYEARGLPAEPASVTLTVAEVLLRSPPVLC